MWTNSAQTRNVTINPNAANIFSIQSRSSSSASWSDVIYMDSEGNAHFTGTIKIGGSSNSGKQILVYNSSGVQSGYWDERGLHIESLNQDNSKDVF